MRASCRGCGRYRPYPVAEMAVRRISIALHDPHRFLLLQKRGEMGARIGIFAVVRADVNGILRPAGKYRFGYNPLRFA